MTTLDVESVIRDPEPRRQAGLVPLEIAIADYDRTRPILDGRVRPEGIALKATARWIGDFCRTPVYEEYDAAEMSFSWYVAARDRGEPVIAVPIFLLRMPVFAYAYVRADSPITKPADLVGKKIGSRGYRQTVNLWLRGLFKEHYGLAPEQVTWVTTEENEGAGYKIPNSVTVEVHKGSNTIDNLRDGVVDAMFSTTVPQQFLKGEKWIRRLFPDAQWEMRNFVERTGIMPITHVLAMNRRLADREPWIAESFYRVFNEAQRQCNETFLDPKRLSLFDSEHILEQQRASYGANPYTHGIEPNRRIIETFVRYAHEQGYVSRQIPVEELFVPQTLSL